MKLDFPTEIFDRAVEISTKRVAGENANQIDAEVTEHLSGTPRLDLSKVPFFRMIYSMILQV